MVLLQLAHDPPMLKLMNSAVSAGQLLHCPCCWSMLLLLLMMTCLPAADAGWSRYSWSIPMIIMVSPLKAAAVLTLLYSQGWYWLQRVPNLCSAGAGPGGSWHRWLKIAMTLLLVGTIGHNASTTGNLVPLHGPKSTLFDGTLRWQIYPNSNTDTTLYVLCPSDVPAAGPWIQPCTSPPSGPMSSSRPSIEVRAMKAPDMEEQPGKVRVLMVGPNAPPVGSEKHLTAIVDRAEAGGAPTILLSKGRRGWP